MSKKVLALYYSQSGQLGEIVESFLKPIKASGATVEILHIKPLKDFPFPWTSEQFFEAMPETVLARPVELAPFSLNEQKYDLVIFAYQPWYLSLSIPAHSIITHESVKKILKDTPVVTLIGARNMWLNSQERLKKLLNECGARLVGNVALVDRHGNLISAATILHWMLSGKKDSWLGIFPKPGVSEEDIARSEIFGATVLEHLDKNIWDGMQQTLLEQNAVEVKTHLMFIEQRAPRLFSIWAKLIINSKHRKLLLTLFKYYLFIALFLVAPLVLFVYSILFQPFLGKSIEKRKEYYLGC